MRRHINEAFGARVRAVLGELSLRAADRQSGVNYGTLGNMSLGNIPEMESVIRFAQGFGLDVNEWLEFAGYPRVETTPSGREWLKASVAALGRKLGRTIPLPIPHHGEAEITLDEALSYFEDIQRQVHEGLL